jgi:hypothetical protein
MMLTEFQKRLTSVAGYKDSRQKYADEVLDNRELISELISLCFETSNKFHPKACWVLELICFEKIESIQEYSEFFCNNIKELTNESAIRSASKICMLLTIAHFKKTEIILSENQLQQLTEACFDWLIKDTKVASKAYSIRTLHIIGSHFDWILPELKHILEKDYANHSPAYKAVAREILKKINNPK